MAEKWVLVAGASGAIGGAACQLLADDGWGILAGYRSGASRTELLVKELEQSGAEAEAVHLDLADAKGVAQTISTLSAEKSIAGVVYAAGPPVTMQHMSRIDPGVYTEQLVNDAGSFFNLVSACLPVLRETQGALVATTTTALARYSVKDVLSVAPKAAVEVTVRGIAAEEGRFGVRANCVGVGVIDSGLWDDLIAQGAYSDKFLDAARQNIALRRFGTAADIAESIRFFMSDRARWVSGQTINVDGGYAL